MNIVSYNSNNNKTVSFCIVDDIETYANAWTKEIIKNIADFTVANLQVKGYDVFVGYDEDELLSYVSDLGYAHSIVMSPGTEFINGMSFFEELKSFLNNDYFIAGHVLDREDAYYELHHQCYLVNLSIYKQLNNPIIGKQNLGHKHTQLIPLRNELNFHDNYTPISVSKGIESKEYNHKCHGWNILSVAFNNDESVLPFTEKLRHNKKHHYPEYKSEFDKNLNWIYYRNHYCATEHVHTKNNEWSNNINGTFDQIIVPSSGTLYLDLINEGTVIFYDYNQKALDYWESQLDKKPNIEYKFIKTDLLIDDNLIDSVRSDSKRTLVNLSNIFCYEGTIALFPVSHRVNRENSILTGLKNKLENECIVNFTMRAANGFTELQTTEELSKLEITQMSKLKKPTWHFNQDWL